MPYIISNTQTYPTNILIDTGANKNIIRPGILPQTRKVKETKIKNTAGCKHVTEKGRINLLGDNFPNQTYYELKFHNFFDALIGSELMAKNQAIINFKEETFEIGNMKLKYEKYFPDKQLYSHNLEMETSVNGDWFVPTFQKLCKGVVIEPGLYRANNNKTTAKILSTEKTIPDVKGKLNIIVNNFETISPIPLHPERSVTNEVLSEIIRTDHLSILERDELFKTILANKTVLLRAGEKLTSTSLIKHKILTTDENPVYTKLYRYPHVFKKDVEEQIKELFDNGIIQHSISPYSSPVWVVPKKIDASGKRKVRVVIDYRKINDKTINDKFPIPQIEEILDNLGKSAYFTTLDLKSGFHQIEMDPDDQKKTAFSTALGHFEFTRMPFGLKNAPATFQRAMNNVLSNYIGSICYVYLDDIIIIGKNLQDHLNNVSKILKRLSDFNLKIQLDKCEFLRRETEFLGHIIAPDGIKPDPEKIRKIQEWKLPSNQKEIKQFLGLVGYYRRFIKDYSKLTKPLTKLLQKDEKVNLNDQEYQEAFKHLKNIIVSDQILSYPDFELPFILTTDASNYALGEVLSQVIDKTEKPIAFASRTLNKTESNYSTTEKEALAIIWAVTKFKPYLYGNKFTLVTDHKPLIYIKNSNKNAKLIRWRLDLENYDYDVIYKTGKTNVVADALSRKVEVNNNQLENVVSVDQVSVENNISSSSSETAHSANTSDDYYMHFTERAINSYRNQIIFKVTDSDSVITEQIFQNYKRTTICSTSFDNRKVTTFLKDHSNGKQNAVLAPECLLNLIQEVYRECFCNTNCHFIITQNMVEDVTSETMQDIIIRKEHDRAHRGITEVESQIKRSYFFPNMIKRIRQLINSCTICTQHKYERKPYNIKISPRPIENGPFYRVHMDIFGMDRHYYLSLICAFSKHLQLIEIKSRNMTDIRNALSQYFRTFRPPRKIICDHEAAFTSIQFQDFLANFGTVIEFASSSESNGQIEKTHSTIIEIYNTNKHKFINNSSPEIVQIANSMYNDTVHSVTTYTPNEIIFNPGYTINPPEIADNADKIFKNVKKNLQLAANRMKKNNDKKEIAPAVNEGHDVYIKKNTRKKLDPRFSKSKCLVNNEKTIQIGPRNVKRNKNKIKRIRT